jgi:hypothetical protein
MQLKNPADRTPPADVIHEGGGIMLWDKYFDRSAQTEASL